MKNFIYETPTKVYFGKDEELKVGKIIAEFHPKKVLVHFGGNSARKSGLLDKVENCLREENISFVELGGVVANPELPLVREGIELGKKEGVDFVLAVGGGSVLDSSKAIANGLANPEVDVWDFHCGKAVPQKTLPKGAFAIEDPVLTYTVSPYQTACGAVDIAMHTIERYFCPGEDTYLTDSIAEAVIKSVRKAAGDCLKDPEDYAARANMMWASSLAHNGLTQCGREFQLVVHQLEHEVSGMYPEVAHGAGLAALWCSWARYVYKANINRWLQYASNVWGLDIDFEHPEKTIETAIDMQEQYYASIGMPIGLKELGVKEDDLAKLALDCSRNKTRSLIGYKPLAYEDILVIYQMAYERG